MIDVNDIGPGLKVHPGNDFLAFTMSSFGVKLIYK